MGENFYKIEMQIIFSIKLVQDFFLSINFRNKPKFKKKNDLNIN